MSVENEVVVERLNPRTAATLLHMICTSNLTLDDSAKSELIWTLAHDQQTLAAWKAEHKIDDEELYAFHIPNAMHALWYAMRRPMHFVKTYTIRNLLRMCQKGPSREQLPEFCKLIPFYKAFMAKYPNVEQARFKYKKEGAFITANVTYIGKTPKSHGTTMRIFQDEDGVVLHAKPHSSYNTQFTYEFGVEFVMTGRISFRAVTRASQPILVQNCDLRTKDGLDWEVDIVALRKQNKKPNEEAAEAKRQAIADATMADPDLLKPNQRSMVESYKCDLAEIERNYHPARIQELVRKCAAKKESIKKAMYPFIVAYVVQINGPYKNSEHIDKIADQVIVHLVAMFKQFRTAEGRYGYLQAQIKNNNKLGFEELALKVLCENTQFYRAPEMENAITAYREAESEVAQAKDRRRVYLKCKSYLKKNAPRMFGEWNWIY